MARASNPDAFERMRELETLRQMIRRELRRNAGQRTLAREIGIHRESLRKFVEGQSIPLEANLEEIRDWAADRRSVDLPLAQVALALLVDDLPPPRRPRARRRFAKLLRELYGETGEGVPTWVTDELQGPGSGAGS
jgi:hypothetical protein